MWKGLALCAAVTWVGFGLASLTPNSVSPLVFALALGVIVGNLPIARNAQSVEAGLTFSIRWLLRTGIVLFGLSVTLQQVFVLGPQVVVLDLLVIATVMIVGYSLGTRWLKLDPETALLTSAGSAICGAAAILATAATIRAKPAVTAMAVATVVMFGSLAMVVYPALFPLLGWEEGLYGVYIGATVHEVAHVVAAGNAVGADAQANAVVVKLVRVMLLVPFLLILGRWWLKYHGASQGNGEPAGKLTVPWFAFGFIAMVVINSLIALPETLNASLTLIGQIALTMAMAALGYETRFEKLRALGVKPLILGLVLFLLLAVGGIAVTPLIVEV
ncbi:MAG: putative sulfate exporter family transporter [Marinobacter sp.]|uniref:YeiH family protein n=1 Tax=Marinobacter sp. TaxID=50741 RepID=UPI0034A0A8F7